MLYLFKYSTQNNSVWTKVSKQCRQNAGNASMTAERDPGVVEGGLSHTQADVEMDKVSVIAVVQLSCSLQTKHLTYRQLHLGHMNSGLQAGVIYPVTKTSPGWFFNTHHYFRNSKTTLKQVQLLISKPSYVFKKEVSISDYLKSQFPQNP